MVYSQMLLKYMSKKPSKAQSYDHDRLPSRLCDTKQATEFPMHSELG
jgi:hypothetical protein